MKFFSFFSVWPTAKLFNFNITMGHIRFFVVKILLLVGFLCFILLIINDRIFIVTLLSCSLKILSNSVMRQFLLLEYELHYKKVAILFGLTSRSTRLKLLYLVKNCFSHLINSEKRSCVL